ncbi:MAG: type II secretion system protein [Planctomycetota bacterium]|jgi:prepilin-type N-terminal cleavage/methylation domain-containing protein
MVSHARAGSRSGAFTLVELLVVVSIIALLISILMPSFKGAREQAKRVKCQSNMRQVNTSLLTYVTEYDIFPVAFSTKESTGCVCGWCTWNYGGWLGTNHEYWINRAGGCFRVPAFKRPLTVYMNKQQVTRPVQASPYDYEISGQPAFKCPSDRISAQWQWGAYGQGTAEDTYSAYDDVGTSYQMNFYWWHQTNKAPGRDHDHDGVIEPTLGVCEPEVIESCNYQQKTNWPCRFRQGRQIWRQYEQHGASRFVTLAEDPFDFAVVNETQELGFHGKFSWHNLAFMDGHADYLRTDTRRHSGPEWTVHDEGLEAPWF